MPQVLNFVRFVVHCCCGVPIVEKFSVIISYLLCQE